MNVYMLIWASSSQAFLLEAQDGPSVANVSCIRLRHASSEATTTTALASYCGLRFSQILRRHIETIYWEDKIDCPVNAGEP